MKINFGIKTQSLKIQTLISLISKINLRKARDSQKCQSIHLEPKRISTQFITCFNKVSLLLLPIAAKFEWSACLLTAWTTCQSQWEGKSGIEFLSCFCQCLNPIILRLTTRKLQLKGITTLTWWIVLSTLTKISKNLLHKTRIGIN